MALNFIINIHNKTFDTLASSGYQILKKKYNSTCAASVVAFDLALLLYRYTITWMTEPIQPVAAEHHTR